ncbi:MAG: hypothetical protein BWY55_00817 [archaeon ADurb.Bin336]|nr:MAG: hypothetical protein BWY55_00817 [archaeon ADurb.Bin336]
MGLVNILAGFYSFSFYSAQLSSSPVWLWVFIADCPLAAILFGLMLILISFGIKIRWLCFLSLIANVKFSLWTIFVLFLSGNIFSLWWVALVHLILLFEVIVFFGLFDFRVKDVLLALIVFSIGDFFDYVLKTHPLMPKEVFLFAGVFAIFSTIFLSITLPLFFSTRIEEKRERGGGRSSFGEGVKKKRWAN